MSVPLPHTLVELYRWLWIADVQSPPLVKLTGHDRNQKWDIQEAKGQTGASSVLNGPPVGGFQAEFYIADDDDMALWERFKAVVESTTNGPTPKALPIYHPDLVSNGFCEVCNAGIGGLVWDSRGGATVLVKFTEYKPPKPKAAKKSKAAPSPSKGVEKKEDPNANAKRELNKLLDEAGAP